MVIPVLKTEPEVERTGREDDAEPQGLVFGVVAGGSVEEKELPLTLERLLRVP